MSDQFDDHVERVTRRATGRGGDGAGSPDAVIEAHLASAEEHAILGTEVGAASRLGPLKRFLLRVLQVITRDQTEFNIQTMSALRMMRMLEAERDERIARLQARMTTGVDARLAAVDLALDGITERLDDRAAAIEDRQRSALARMVDEVRDDLTEEVQSELGAYVSRLDQVRGEVEERADEVVETARRFWEDLDEMRAAIAESVDRLARHQTQLTTLRNRVDLFLKEARRRLPEETFDEDELRGFARQLAGRFDALYADFEDSFRGTRSEIKEKLNEYLDDVHALEDHGGAPVVDIGCGRGEWLEVLNEANIPGYGVDINETFIERNRDRGLEVVLADALDHLNGLEEASLKAVTGFHIIEHLEFETLLELLDACLYALRPGGAIIFETPNPTNLVVGAASFYTDPTHKAPLHPQLMDFVAASRGFVDVEIRYLHPAAELPFKFAGFDGPDGQELRRLVDELNWALRGPQDYAVIAYKAPGRLEDS